MVFCCLPFGWTVSHDDYNTKRSNESIGSSGFTIYPGRRRASQQLYETGGNALAAIPPQHSSNNTVGTNTSSAQYVQLQPQHPSEQDLVAVKVPYGVQPGQTIRVLHPDRSGRQIEAVVPDGMHVGSTFYVQSPSNSVFPSSTTAIPVTPTSSSGINSNSDSQPWAVAHPIGDYSNVVPLAAPSQNNPTNSSTLNITDQQPPPFSQCLGHPTSSQEGRQQQLYVQPSSATSTSRNDNNFSNTTNSSLIEDIHPPYGSRQHGKQKLVLVRVPPGTLPGTTMYVQIPDKPGRIVTAEVPPGAVTEFYVSYESENQLNHDQQVSQYQDVPSTRGYIHHPNDSWTQPSNRQPYIQPQHSTTSQRLNSQRNGGTSTTRNNNDGDWILPAAGGFATGLASMMIFDHFAHGD